MPPKCTNSTRKSTRKPKSVKKALSLPNINSIKHVSLEEYGKSKNTKKAYKGHLSQGMKFLDEMVAQRIEAGTDKDGIETALLAKAFDNPPNRYSAMALELFITQKCFNEGLGLGTCDGIHATFAKFWGEMCVLF
jgi:hypothetical protein